MIWSSECAGCGRPGERLCHVCRFALASVGSVTGSCGIAAAFPFDGVARQLVVALKYRHRRHAADVLAIQMVRRLRLAAVDLVTWAPTSPRRVRRRGYDQAEAIARAVARQLGVPCRRMLYRSHGGPQTGKSRADRLLGPAFRARRPRRGLAVLVVDDVVTTGATLLAAASALRTAGVDRVELAAAASADKPRPPRPVRSPTGRAATSVPRSLPRSTVGLQPAWASSIASSELVKARS